MSSTAVDYSFEKYAIGQSVSRLEDPRLLTGKACFTDDFNLPEQAYAYVLRSPHAHARIKALELTAARQAPGVLTVLSAGELDAAGVGPLPCGLAASNRDGTPMHKPPRPVLATGRVRYCGEALVLLVAESLAQARAAAELVELQFDTLPAVTDAIEAMASSAPLLHRQIANNIALDWEFGDSAAVVKVFAQAHHVTRLKLRNNRVHVAPMEPRAAVAEYDAASGHYTLHVPSQGVFGFANGLANNILHIPREQLRVRTYDVGGSFGMKSSPYPEYVAALVAARQLQRPVKWCDERSDSFLSDQHGRDSYAEAELAFDADAKILAGRVRVTCNVGAYLTAVGPAMHTRNVPRNFPGPYRLPMMHARTQAVFSNTTPIGAYRGAGRPEGVYYMERLLDTAALEMGIDRVELRRRNLITAAEIPYPAVSGLTYDSGDFPAVFEHGLRQADWHGFELRRQQSAARGKIRGLGLAAYLEVTGPPSTEMGGIRFEDDGTVSMISGSLNYGQGHHSAFAQIVTSKLHIPFDRLRLIQGDSDELIAGAGSGGSRTVISAGTALSHAAEQVIDNGIKLAAHVLEAATDDIEFVKGAFVIAGTDRSIGIMELAGQIRLAADLPGDLPTSLSARIAEDTPPSAFPNGCHVAEVEIDPETGVTEVVRYGRRTRDETCRSRRTGESLIRATVR